MIEMSGWKSGAMDDLVGQDLRDVLAGVDSPDWSVRAAAGRRLAAVPRIEEVADVLHRLLLDPHDTGVTSDTAVALLARRDVAGLRALLRARAVASSDGTADQLDAELDCDAGWMTDEGGDQLIAQLRTLTSDADPDVRSEALLRLARLN
ncbi:hypothetical protein ACWGFX_01905 [Streptomyces xanthophaeus]